MKRKSIKLGVAALAAALAFGICMTACNSTKLSQRKIESKIVGKWKLISENGVPVLTNRRVVTSFCGNGKGTNSYSIQTGSGYIWNNKAEMKYSVTGNILYIDNREAGNIEFFENISSISADEFSAHTKRVVVGKDDKEREVTRKRVTADYSQDIIGMWEGVEMTGDETYAGIEARIDYKADGTYTYYKKVDGEWQPLADVTDEWNVDGDWLATRWQNNGSDVMNYEWWDIDYIKQEGDDTIMKWSALREKEDGTRFTTTFTWKKIDTHPLQNLTYKPGQEVPESAIISAGEETFFKEMEIPDDIFALMQGKSYKEDCTVPKSDLRYILCLHRDINGKAFVGEMVVNKKISATVLNIFYELYKANYPIERMRLVDYWDADDEMSMRDNNSSSFNFRFISHTTKVSKHGLGVAVDINTLYNPYHKTLDDGTEVIEPATGAPYLDRSKTFPYKIEKGDLCYRLFTENGFEWGGDWTTLKDYQHFELIESE